jgi:hypothetical protein
MSQVYVLFYLQPYYILHCYYLLHIICFPHLVSTNHKCIQHCYFPPTTQTYCSEGEDVLEFFDDEF